MNHFYLFLSFLLYFSYLFQIKVNLTWEQYFSQDDMIILSQIYPTCVFVSVCVSVCLCYLKTGLFSAEKNKQSHEEVSGLYSVTKVIIY